MERREQVLQPLGKNVYVCSAEDVNLQVTTKGVFFDEERAEDIGFQEVRSRKSNGGGGPIQKNWNRNMNLHGSNKAPAVGDVGRFTVFVDYISKKESRKWPRDIFEQYGRVDDVFIAYKNSRRAKYESTFGFVRFRSRGEMLKAVEQADRLQKGTK